MLTTGSFAALTDVSLVDTQPVKKLDATTNDIPEMRIDKLFFNIYTPAMTAYLPLKSRWARPAMHAKSRIKTWPKVRQSMNLGLLRRRFMTCSAEGVGVGEASTLLAQRWW